MMPYRWQCEAERCYRQRDRAGRWQAHGRDMGTDDPGRGHRYHPECVPDEHTAEPVTVREAGLRDLDGVIVCRVCHVPVRTIAGNRYPVHTSPRSRWCGSTCPLHGGPMA